MQDKDVIDVLRKEGVKLKMLMHAHQAFYVVVPEGSKIEEFKVNFLFKNVTDVLKMQAIGGRSCTAPIYAMNKKDKVLMFVQMEIKAGAQHSFDESRDKRAFEIISKITTAILERIFVNARTAETHDRAYKILKTCKCLSFLLPSVMSNLLLFYFEQSANSCARSNT